MQELRRLRGNRAAASTSSRTHRSLFDADSNSDSDPAVEVGECAGTLRRLTPAEVARLARSGDKAALRSHRRLSAGISLGMTITAKAHAAEANDSGMWVS